jgi:hypothetical protein
MSEDKIKKKIKEYQTFVLKDIFSEYGLKEYINGIEKIVQKNGGCHKNGFCEDHVWGNGKKWFYAHVIELLLYTKNSFSR